MQRLHTETRKGGLSVWREPCCSLWLPFVAVTSVTSLLGYSEPKPTVPGIAILLVAAAVIMPWLCERETAAVKSYRQCYVDGGLGTVGVVRLPIVHRLGGTGDQRDLAGQVGRPGCSFSRFAAHCLGGSGGHAREDLRLLLGSPHFGKYGSEENSRGRHSSGSFPNPRSA